MTPADTLVRMALRLAERGDAEGAAEALRGVLAMRTTPTPTTSTGPRAITIAEAARVLGYSSRHVRTLIERGDIPTIGCGRATRVLIDEAISTLRGSRAHRDDVAGEGAAWARRRGALRVVDGGE